METEEGECPHCGEDVLISRVPLEDGKVVTILLQRETVEGFDQDGHRWRGHERHWKYCSSRPTTGTESAAPPENSGEPESA